MTDTITTVLPPLISFSFSGEPAALTKPAILQLSSTPPPPPAALPPPTKAFPFLRLPAELRLRIYELHLRTSEPIDLDPKNARHLAPRLALLLANRQLHDEAYRVFYSTNTFRLFPVHGRFFHTRRPLLARLPPHYRAAIKSLELRLGPGWTAPPRGWAVSDALGLADLHALRTLDVFIECDPAADAVFAGFRRSERFYTDFCVELVRAVVGAAPGIAAVRFDAWNSVPADSPLLAALVAEVKGKRRSVEGFLPLGADHRAISLRLKT